MYVVVPVCVFRFYTWMHMFVYAGSIRGCTCVCIQVLYVDAYVCVGRLYTWMYMCVYAGSIRGCICVFSLSHSNNSQDSQILNLLL